MIRSDKDFFSMLIDAFSFDNPSHAIVSYISRGDVSRLARCCKALRAKFEDAEYLLHWWLGPEIPIDFRRDYLDELQQPISPMLNVWSDDMGSRIWEKKYDPLSPFENVLVGHGESWIGACFCCPPTTYAVLMRIRITSQMSPTECMEFHARSMPHAQLPRSDEGYNWDITRRVADNDVLPAYIQPDGFMFILPLLVCNTDENCDLVIAMRTLSQGRKLTAVYDYIILYPIFDAEQGLTADEAFCRLIRRENPLFSSSGRFYSDHREAPVRPYTNSDDELTD